jgi:ubiquinone/menaquinone biosynthesis C-methylase UbiE
VTERAEKREEWAEGNRKKMIVDERKFLWTEEQVERLAASMGLSPGMTVVDPGCGQGYLGWTYWKHFGKGGTYMGIDHSAKLLDEAVELAGGWASDGRALFSSGDCCALPLPDGIADAAMCQTLLMHLEFPEKALAEMVRVTKPGGVIMCKEPDNVSSMLKRSYSTVEEEDIDEMLARRKWNIIWARGRKNLGKGDWGIGTRVPRMMYEAGLVAIEGFCNEKLEFLQPPYDSPQMQNRISIIRGSRDEDTPENRRKWKRESRECHLAGGMSTSSFYRYHNRMVALADGRRDSILEQLDNGTYFGCSGGSSFFCIMGRKPG